MRERAYHDIIKPVGQLRTFHYKTNLSSLYIQAIIEFIRYFFLSLFIFIFVDFHSEMCLLPGIEPTPRVIISARTESPIIFANNGTVCTSVNHRLNQLSYLTGNYNLDDDLRAFEYLVRDLFDINN
jgi:hypothetical protein